MLARPPPIEYAAAQVASPSGSHSLASLARRLAPAAMPLAYLAFTLLVFWQLWTPIDGARGFFRYDPRFEYWGDLQFQWNTLSHGHLALWNPFDRAGFPLYGDPQPGMLYPVNWLFLLLSSLSGGVSYLMVGVKILAHWAFGAIGMHLFLRRLGAREPACYLGGILYGWTSPKVRYSGSALNWSIAWIPWLLLAVDWFADRPSWRRATVLGSTAAMVLLAGAPAVLLYAALIATPYLIYRMWGRWRGSWRHLAIAAGVAVLWVLPLVASNLQQVPESIREARDLTFITNSAFTPADFAGFLIPHIGGENVYYGLLPLLCVGLLCASAGRTRSLLLLGIAAAGVALALGDHAGILPAIASALPPFAMFRRAHRYLFVTSIAIAALAGLGLARALTLEIEEQKRTAARRVTWVGGAVTFAMGMAFLISLVVSDKFQAPKNQAFGLAFVAAAAATWLLRAILVNQGRRRTVYGWFAVVVVALDIWTAGARSIDVGMIPPPIPRHDGLVAELGNLTTEYRIYDRGYLNFRPGTRLGIRDFGGYEDDPLGLARYKLFLDQAKRNLSLLGHANVRYYLDGGRRPPVKPRPADHMTTLRAHVYELPAVAPAVLYVATPRPVADPGAGLKALRDIVPGRGAVVEGPLPPAGPAGGLATGKLVELTPNRVVAEIDTPGPGLVVIAEAYYPAWRATVDDTEVTIQPANVMFRGVPVAAAGHHRIVMTLRPLRFWGLFPAYLIGFGLLIAALVAPFVRRRRRATGEPAHEQSEGET